MLRVVGVGSSSIMYVSGPAQLDISTQRCVAADFQVSPLLTPPLGFPISVIHGTKYLVHTISSIVLGVGRQWKVSRDNIETGGASPPHNLTPSPERQVPSGPVPGRQCEPVCVRVCSGRSESVGSSAADQSRTLMGRVLAWIRYSILSRPSHKVSSVV